MLARVEVLKIVDDSEAVDVLAAFAQIGVSVALELFHRIRILLNAEEKRVVHHVEVLEQHDVFLQTLEDFAAVCSFEVEPSSLAIEV